MNRCWERNTLTVHLQKNGNICVCGDNGAQTQSIRHRKKIAKRKKIKGNAWTLVLMLNQPFLSILSTSLSHLLAMCREKRGERFPDIRFADAE